MLTKAEIRSKILLKLKTQKEDTRRQKSSIIRKKLLRTKVFKKAKTIMFYIAFDGEVNTEEMIREARLLNKIIAVPVCKKNRITIRPCLLGKNPSLTKGPYGVCEPAVKKSIKLKDIDLVVVPGVAFDKNGNRLGRGKGCYDRLLKLLPTDTPSIGLAFDFQIIPSLPTQEHDVGVNKLIFA